jgi:hypothetical protein
VARRPDKHSPPLIRPIPALLAVVAGLAVSVAVAWGSSTELGQTTTSPIYSFNADVVQVSTVADSPSYRTSDGVLTSWRYHSGASGGSVKLKIFQRIGVTSNYKAAAASSLKGPLDPNKGYSFGERIPVKDGDLLGLTAVAAQTGITVVTGTPTDDNIGRFTADIPVGSTGAVTAVFSNSVLSLAATVESDADKDGYGDESQDECPTDASTQGACPTPPSSDTAGPKLTFGGSAKQKLGSSVVVTVTCDEACSIAGNGSVSTSKPKASKTLSLKQAALALPAGTSGQLKLKLSKKSRGKIKRALRSHRKATASVNVTAKDGAGNATVATRKIKLSRRR